MKTSLFDRLANTVGEGENVSYHHFLLSRSVFRRVVKCPHCVVHNYWNIPNRNELDNELKKSVKFMMHIIFM